MKKKRGQITIFIIISIILIALIAFYFLAKSGIVPGISSKKEINPNSFLKICTEDKIKEAVEILSLNGGSIKNPLNKTFFLSEEKDFQEISYLCYTNEKNKLCTNQESMLIPHVKNEIHDYISENVEDCFYDLKTSLEKDGYGIESKYNGFVVLLNEEKVFVNINAEIILSKTDEVSKEENFSVATNSRIYNLLVLSQNIINHETISCDFNYALFMFNYPDVTIEKIRSSNSDIIYIITDKKSNEAFRFAIRGCVISL